MIPSFSAPPDEEDLASVLAEVRRIEVQSKRLVTGLMAGAYNSVFRGAGIEFDEVREYVEGDDPSEVDWNLTARTGVPHVKTFVDQRELTIVFLLDLSASMEAGLRARCSPRQLAARLCACLAFSAIRNNDKVGLIAFSEDVDAFVPPRKGNAQVLRLLRETLVLRGRSPRSDIATALDFTSQVLRRHAIVFLISDFLGLPETGSEERDHLQRSLMRCGLRHDLIACRLLLPELEARAEGICRVRDPEGGLARLVDWSDPRFRSEYEGEVTRWNEEVETLLRNAHLDSMEVALPTVPDPSLVPSSILRFFRMREQRGMKR